MGAGISVFAISWYRFPNRLRWRSFFILLSIPDVGAGPALEVSKRFLPRLTIPHSCADLLSCRAVSAPRPTSLSVFTNAPRWLPIILGKRC